MCLLCLLFYYFVIFFIIFRLCFHGVQMNGRSSFLDASIIYGHSTTRAMQLRTFENGHLKTDAATSLPLNVDGVAMNPTVDPRLQRLTGSTSFI
jgi:hypothetical protein